jgi:hypothetical protein
LRRAATAKKQGRTARLKSAPKPENKSYNHFTPIKGTSQRALLTGKPFILQCRMSAGSLYKKAWCNKKTTMRNMSVIFQYFSYSLREAGKTGVVGFACLF